LDVGEVGRRLNVGAVVTGSVRRAGGRLRVRAELADATGGSQLWAESYDRDLSDIFAVQDELARATVQALEVRLKGSRDQPGPLVKPPTVDLEAHDLCLRGNYFRNKRTRDSLLRAIGYFERAIARDAGYVEAYSGLAFAYALLAFADRHNQPAT
jgi:hypothetical protein